MTAVDESTTSLDGLSGVATTWMTCVRDRREHAVSEPDFALGVPAGLYQALCGQLVMPRALVSPCGPRCPNCVATLGVATGSRAWPTPRGRGHCRGRHLVALPRWVSSWTRGVLGRHTDRKNFR